MKKLLEWGLILTVIGSVCAFGAVQPFAHSLMEVSLLALLSLFLFAQTRQGRIDLPLPLGILPFVLFVALQLVPLPPQLVGVLSPARVTFVGNVPRTTFGAAWTTLSIYPHQTFVMLCQFLGYFAAFILAAVVFDWRRKSSLVRALILLGCFEAVYGMVQYLTGYQKIFWYSKIFYIEEATGTYINRNHYAGLLEMLVPLGLTRVFYLLQSPFADKGTDRRTRESGSPWQVVLYGFSVVLMLMGIFYSRSRMGIFSVLFVLVFITLIGQLRAGSRIWAIGAAGILFCSISYALWIGLGPVLLRYEAVSQRGFLEIEGRLSIWRDATRLIQDYPLVGTGLGTFGTAFWRYQTTLVTYSIDHTHSDYLEYASELGVLGAMLLFIPVVYLWAKMLRAFFIDPSRHRRSILLGCIGSIFAILIHATTDFNFQIPANAMLFAIILGIGYKLTSLQSENASWVEDRGKPVEGGQTGL